jgi:hypothetical protein
VIGTFSLTERICFSAPIFKIGLEIIRRLYYIYPGEKMLRKTVIVSGDTLVIPELKNFKGRKVEITLNELPEREKFPIKKKSRKTLKDFFGKLNAGEDALEFQKRIRAEWDEREKSF